MALRIVYKDENTTFQELLNEDNSVTSFWDVEDKKIISLLYQCKNYYWKGKQA